MRSSALLGAALLLTSSVASAHELLRVYDLAAQNDTQLQAARHAHDANVTARPAAFGALLPQVNGVGNASRQRDELFTYQDVCLDPPTCSVIDKQGISGTKSGSPFSVTLRATQTLFDWAAFSRYGQAGDTVALAEAQFLKEQQNLALRVSTAYFNFLASADTQRFAEANQAAFERQLEQAKKRFEVGLSAITDVQDAQARYDSAVAQKLAADQDLANTRQAVIQITNAPDVRINPLQDDIPLAGPEPLDVKEWLKAAHDGNLDLISARLTAQIADADIGIQRAGHYPTLGLSATKARVKQAGFNEFYDNQDAVGVQVTVPLFAGGQVHQAVNRAEAIADQRKAELEGVNRTVDTTTRNAHLAVITGVARVKALKQAVLSNTTAVEASQVGLEVGTRTQVDVLNAQQLLFAAQRDYARARYDYLLSVLQLKFTAGRLTQQDLASIDKLLTEGGSAVAQ
jgi:outer membrane protein